jgi:hypothetical protein
MGPGGAQQLEPLITARSKLILQLEMVTIDNVLTMVVLVSVVNGGE